MNEINQEPLDAEPQDSTIIDPDAVASPAPDHKAVDTRDDAISKALDDAEAATSEDAPEPAKPEKVEKAPKPEDNEGEEADPAEEAEEGEEGDEEQPETKPREPKKPQRPTIPAPEKFEQAAKEHWPSVPHVVRADIQRVINEYEGQAEYLRPAAARYNDIREYDEIAASNGVDLRQTLADVKDLEDLMEVNPLAAVNKILLRAGPRKPDGQPVSLYELADAIVKMGPEGYQRALAQQPAQQQQQRNPEMEQLRAEVAAMKADQTRTTVISPFAVENPRFNEPAIQQSIAQILKSGMVQPSLPAQERLAAAYDMAVRLNPSAEYEPAPVETQEQATPRRVDGNGGSRSVRGAPPSGSNKGPAKRVLSRDDAINAAMAALR